MMSSPKTLTNLKRKATDELTNSKKRRTINVAKKLETISASKTMKTSDLVIRFDLPSSTIPTIILK